jgi:hypothetical protein
MLSEEHSVLWFVFKILLVNVIAIFLVIIAGGFGNGKSLTDYAYGFWISGFALMAVGFVYWKSGTDPRDNEGRLINYWRVLGVEEANEFIKRERFKSYKIMNFWFIAGLLPFGVGTIFAIFIR